MTDNRENTSSSRTPSVPSKTIFYDKQNQKPSRNFLRENPLIGLGCACTVGCLGTGIYYLAKRDSAKQNMMMRGRVLFQGLTVAVIIISFYSLQKKSGHNQIQESSSHHEKD